MNRIYLESYSCTTGAGVGSSALLDSLYSGHSWVQRGLCRIAQDKMARASVLLWSEKIFECCWNQLSNLPFPPTFQKPVGFILASTKGQIEDFLCSPSPLPNCMDPLEKILTRSIKKLPFPVTRSISISNACASSHSALFLAYEWLKNQACQTVLIFAVDFLGNFIEKGFRSLQAVCAKQPTPFGKNRDGVALGEGGAILVLTIEPSFDFQNQHQTKTARKKIELEKVAIYNEGTSFMKPKPQSLALSAAVQEVTQTSLPDLILAHGTGTIANDVSEDQIFASYFPSIPITGTKWCVGHTLGASGVIDVIAAAEILQRQKVFSLSTTLSIDPSLKGKYLTPNTILPQKKWERVLITSLGFGGVYAALQLKLKDWD